MSVQQAEKKTVVRFAALEGIYWTIMASFGSFAVAWMLDLGYTQSFVSGLLVVYLLSGFAGQFYLSSLCDRLRTNRKVFLAGVLLAAAAQLGMWFSVDCPPVFAVCYACYGFTLGPMGSVLDAWMVRSFHEDMAAYAPARGLGSIGYAVMMLVMGQLIARFGYHMMPLCAMAVTAVTLVLALATPEGPFAAAQTRRIALGEVLSILRIPAFLVILAVLFFISMVNTPISNFKITLLQSVGGDVSTHGMDSFFGCMVQFLVFEFAALFARIPARGRFRLCAVLMTLSTACHFGATAPWMVIVGTMVTNVSYGLMMPAVRELAVQIVAPQYHTTAIGVMDAMYNFLGGAAAQLFMGGVSERWGVHGMVGVCLALSVLPPAVLGAEHLLTHQKKGKRA